MKEGEMKNKVGLEMKYFVLNPNRNDAYGLASRRAIHTYAQDINRVNKKLARELIRWMCEIDHKILDKNIKDGKVKP